MAVSHKKKMLAHTVVCETALGTITVIIAAVPLTRRR